MRLISGSIWRKLAVLVVAIAAFVLLYETQMFDSTSAALQSFISHPSPGARLRFQATAYCKGTTTASGVGVRTGIAAADPQLLPVGSVLNIAVGDNRYNGVYTVMDTGPKVQGRILDLYMWSCHEALAFGRKDIDVTVLRLGWNPRASTPSLISTLFRRREKDKAAAVAGATGATGTTDTAVPVATEPAVTPASNESAPPEHPMPAAAAEPPGPPASAVPADQP